MEISYDKLNTRNEKNKVTHKNGNQEEVIDSMKKEVSTLIVGGSYFGVGYASAHPDCMILEASHILGGDFHRGLRTADVSGIGVKEADTELGKLMLKYGVLKGEQFDVLKAAPVLHEYCNQNNMNIIMDAKLLSIEKVSDGYCVKYITNSGIHEVHCENVLDASVLRDTCPKGICISTKSLNLFTVRLQDTFEEELRKVAPNCIIEEGFNGDERVVKFPFPVEQKLPEACETVVALWSQAFPGGEEKILFLAQDFDYTCHIGAEESAPYTWVGADFANPLSAFAAGMDYQM